MWTTLGHASMQTSMCDLAQSISEKRLSCSARLQSIHACWVLGDMCHQVNADYDIGHACAGAIVPLCGLARKQTCSLHRWCSELRRRAC